MREGGAGGRRKRRKIIKKIRQKLCNPRWPDRIFAIIRPGLSGPRIIRPGLSGPPGTSTRSSQGAHPRWSDRIFPIIRPGLSGLRSRPDYPACADRIIRLKDFQSESVSRVRVQNDLFSCFGRPSRPYKPWDAPIARFRPRLNYFGVVSFIEPLELPRDSY